MIPEDWNSTVSSLRNSKSLTYTTRTVALVELITLAAAPDVVPINISPWIVSVKGADLFVSVTLGRDGFAAVLDSKTAWTLRPSGTYKHISLSSTLFPYMELAVTPFWATVTPWVLLIVIVLHLFRVLFWDLTIVFFTVAIRMPFVLSLTPLNFNVSVLYEALNDKLPGSKE